jgi:glutaredoxin
MVELKVFTLPNCPNCPAAKKIVEEVSRKYGVAYREIDIGTPDGQLEGLMYQVTSTPSIAIDDEVIARGKVIPINELEEALKRKLQK